MFTGGTKFPLTPGIVGALFSLLLVQPAMAEDESKPCNSNGQPIAYGDVLVGCTIDIITDLDQFPFMGTDGERITISATRTEGGFQCVVVRGPGNLNVALPCGNARMEIELLGSGEHRIFVNEQFNDQTVTFNLSLERLFPLRSPTPIAPDQIIVGREILPTPDIDTFQFNATAGDEFVAILTKTGGAGFPCAEIRGPDNTIVASNQCGNVSLAPSPLPVSGVYQIVVTEQFNDQAVTYNLGLNCLFGTCPAPPPICIVEPSFAGSTLQMDFVIGTAQPARWSLVLLAFATTFTLFSHPFPEGTPTISFPIDIPDFPSIGRIGLLSTLTTAEGLSCTDLETVETGTPAAGVTSDTLQRFLRERRE